ncbi:MAG TPA: OmpA family protein [Catalimonadaceae bacterium]|nr:OmpA family protein [Catalimonadaceae bacterium]
MKNSFLFLFLLAAFSSCVSQLKYDRLNTEVSGLRNERDEALKRAESTKLDNAKLEKENKSLVDENGKLKLDSAASGIMYRKNKQLLNDLFDKYDRLDKSYNSLLSNSQNEQTLTEKEVQRKEQEIIKKEKELNVVKEQIAKAQAELDKKKEETAQLSKEVGTKDTKIKEMESKMAQKEKAMEDIRAKLSSALLTLNNANLEVTLKDGKVYVVLPNKTLFSTGSYKLQQEGKKAIVSVSQVLAQNPDLEVSVEGHTDNDPIKPKAPSKKGAKPVASTGIRNNWDLSSLRAATVAEELYLQGVAGNRISATGRGEFQPLDLSNSEVAKQRNRRIELIISPKLSGLYEILNKEEKK